MCVSCRTCVQGCAYQVLISWAPSSTTSMFLTFVFA